MLMLTEYSCINATTLTQHICLHVFLFWLFLALLGEENTGNAKWMGQEQWDGTGNLNKLSVYSTTATLVFLL